MVVITLELVPPRLRGTLTRWMLEIAPGTYVGSLSAIVRDLVWQAIIEQAGNTGRAIMVYRTNNEQGYAMRVHGDRNRTIIDLDGIQLIAQRNAAWQAWLEDEQDHQHAEQTSAATTQHEP
jgi:CRISPR-associated protein Cas2